MGIGISKPLLYDEDGFEIISRETLDYYELVYKRRRNTAIAGFTCLIIFGIILIRRRLKRK
jgi:hypothetical protein